MTHTYNISGMTCNNCLAKVKSELLKLPTVSEMSKHISLYALQQAISPDKKYTISVDHSDSSNEMMSVEENKSWLATYKPLLLIFGYITVISFISSFRNNEINFNGWMNILRRVSSSRFLSSSCLI